MHHIDVSIRFTRLPSKANYEKTLLLGLIPNLTCDGCCRFTYTSICRKYSHFVTLCKELHKISIIKLCKVYTFKSYLQVGTRQNKFYFNNWWEILRNSWSYCITVLQVQRPLRTETLEKIRESFFREFCF